MRFLVCLAGLSLLVAGHHAWGRAQQSSPVSAAVQDEDSLPDDIIVERYRHPKRLPTGVEPPPTVSGVRNRVAFENSERLAKCAARSRLGKRDLLRAVVDGEFNSSHHAMAQHRLKRLYITCSEGTALLSMTSAPTEAGALTGDALRAAAGGMEDPAVSGATEGAPLGHSIYDRGAFMIEAMKLYAPDLQLTTAQLSSTDVRERFWMREKPRNRFRLGADKRYFDVASCIVQHEPRLSVRLAMSEGPAELPGLQAALVNRARECVGGAKKVVVDATQFRIYIADAVYRWAVAARGVDSLIPFN